MDMRSSEDADTWDRRALILINFSVDDVENLRGSHRDTQIETYDTLPGS
jgi:hypothetical protein